MLPDIKLARLPGTLILIIITWAEQARLPSWPGKRDASLPRNHIIFFSGFIIVWQASLFSELAR